jgi:predicted patatin/cPLA2 family phospholipase
MRLTRYSRMLAAGVLAAAMIALLPQFGLAAPRARSAACAQPAQNGLFAFPDATGQSAACGRGVRVASNAQVKRSAARRSKATRKVAPQAAVPAAPKPLQAPPPRVQFSAKEQAVATIPGIPDARFWADSEEEYRRVLGALNGPWLALSAGGEDSAFGAGLLNGLSESGRRPDYVMVSGVSSGALLAPFAFLGSSRDGDLKREATMLSAPDVFEDRRTAESLMDTWPLREFIAKRYTPQLLADIAAEHRRGRRLIVITTNIDSARPVAWNMGAIAAAGGDAALKLFRDILAATSAIPGLFPPVMIEVDVNGHRVTEMHVDGGLAATIYVAPDSMLLGSSALRLPASQITLILNSKLMADFAMTDRHLVGVLGRSLSVGVKRATRSAAILIAGAARRAGTEFNVAYVDQGFDFPSRGLFDPVYMNALFEAGLKQGRSAEPFRHSMPDAARPEASPPQAAVPQTTEKAE